ERGGGGVRAPASTYRLQLTAERGFDHVRRLVPYLDALGVEAVYLAPIFTARAGSEHGYDVVDVGAVSPALGGDAGLLALSAALRERGMGLVVDFVPNHMAACLENPWWRDVLAHGRASEHAATFDIDWDPPWPSDTGRLLLATLGDRYGAVLERGELALAWSEAREALVVRYWEHELPLDPATIVPVLVDVLAALAVLDAVCARWNGAPGAPGSFDRLDGLLRAQVYRLSYWQTAEHEINYRRFFNISDLVGLRQEVAAVRERTHARLLELVRDGVVTGLRLDHVDGLVNPRAYLAWLDARLRGLGVAEPWVVVEKILAADEQLPADWPVAGTTGYDLLNAVNRAMVDPDGLDRLDALYRRFTGRRASWDAIARRRKRDVMDTLFQADLRTLEWDLAALARDDRHGCDVAADLLRRALEEVTAALDVYRTYVEDEPPAGDDLTRIERAVAAARERAPGLGDAPFDVVERALRLDVGEPGAARAFVHRWQQLCAPVMAKGVEDTSLYVYNRLLSLNTVGGDPDRGALSVRDLHRFNEARRRASPTGMSTSDTHDAKRGEDARARLNVLTAMPSAWGEHLTRWSSLNAAHRALVDDEPAPSANDEVLVYQTLLGVWPVGRAPAEAVADVRERVAAYVLKALREAKERTSWHDRHEGYEKAVLAFVEGVLADPGEAFVRELADFAAVLGRFGAYNSLAALALKLASPGVADVYQGGELWAHHLVDPDNRRDVDFDARREALAALAAVPPGDAPRVAAELLAAWEDGRVKLWVTQRGLRDRRARRRLYLEGDYRPMKPSAGARGRVIAFAREHRGDWLVGVAALRAGVWAAEGDGAPTGRAWASEEVTLPAGAPRRWRDVLTDRTITAETASDGSLALRLDGVLAALPVALLAPAEARP
ncbi:MAG: malto-oligosyltrehalose synthase, partial [Myxococcales bacterium]|nr:malto-oligosyltrehalose synthase [Myxococcales bacterium]